MIARIWHGWTSPGDADAYVAFLEREMFVEMGELDGYCGVHLLRRPAGDEVEVITITYWDSRDALRRFAGEDYQRAVVKPEARALLSRFDERSAHYEVLAQP
jgi:heme-degrading monooxygenase HmoA